MDLMCKCRRQEQQVSDLRKLVDEVAKLEAGAPDASGGDNSGNWETQSVCSDVSGVSRFCRGPYACLCATMQSGRVASVLLGTVPCFGRSAGQCIPRNQA